MRKQQYARDQSLDKFGKFWIDLNKATAMRPEAKAQIYSVNEDLPAWKNSQEKEKGGGEVADEKVNCK